MEPQPISRKTLPKRLEHLPRVGLVLEADHGVIRVPDQASPTADPWNDVALEPPVEHVVKVEVAEDRRQHRPLHRPLLRLSVLVAVENPDVQTLADEPL